MVINLRLKEFLKEDKDSRKVFGKKELEIILKQIEGLPLKQSEKNRLSRDIKPKLRFIENAAEFKSEFRLEKNQDNKRIIKKAVAAILSDKSSKNIKAILLFGSFADKSFTYRSDIDICAVFDRDMSSEETTRFRIRIAGQLPDKVDIQVFNVLPQKIKKDIARSHKVLYKTGNYDNLDFSIRYLKDDDYFIRMERIFGVEA